MKILIFSDLHGKIENIESFLFLNKEIGHYVFAGDFFGYFVADRRLADFVKKLRPEFVIGNHDVYYLQEILGKSALKSIGPIESRLMSSEEYQNKYGALVETSEHARGEDFHFLQNAGLNKKVTIDGVRFFICHGSPEDPLEGYIYPDDPGIEQYYERYEFDVLVLGHTHKAFISSRGGRSILNPGSCTLPRGEGAKPSVILYETNLRKATMVELEQRLNYVRDGKNRVRLLS